MCHLLNVPVDIGHEIWQHIDDPATFHSLSLTAKALVPISQRRIFHELRFRPCNSLQTWRKSRKSQLRDCKLRLVGLAHTPHLLSYVNSISIQGEDDERSDTRDRAVTQPPPDEFDFDCSLQNALSDCLSRMTSVVSISMNGFQLVTRLMDALLIVMERQPIKLDMERVSLPDPSWPITTTRLVGLRAGHCSSFMSEITGQVIQNLARSSQETLHLLSLDSYDAHTIEPILSYSFPNLISLNLSRTQGEVEELELAIASFITQHALLTRLVLPVYYIPIRSEAVPMLMEIEGSALTIVSSLLNERPISTITVSIGHHLDLVLVLGMLKETSGTKTTSLTLTFLEGLDSQPTWAELIRMVHSATPNLTSFVITFETFVVRLHFRLKHRIF
jgi:hypothetical protein